MARRSNQWPSRTSESATLSEYASTPPVSPQMAIAPVGRRGWERRGEQLHAASLAFAEGDRTPQSGRLS